MMRFVNQAATYILISAGIGILAQMIVFIFIHYRLNNP